MYGDLPIIHNISFKSLHVMLFTVCIPDRFVQLNLDTKLPGSHVITGCHKPRHTSQITLL